jgi:hypothetical protein
MGMHAGEVLDKKSLPIKYLGFSPCYRRVAPGRWGCARLLERRLLQPWWARRRLARSYGAPPCEMGMMWSTLCAHRVLGAMVWSTTLPHSQQWVSSA